ncbi:MAG TPA: CDGSH iron-sulfur domain-containing protein [Methylomirabilota bacterium]|nr:CDGSH iron-sulfur domain-containing protein [Methylomirabilota bacterium]
MDKPTIMPKPNGPYIVKGPIRLVDADGTEYRLDRETIALCRCGGSTTKPFCDGTHSKIGFQAAEKAVREAGKTP